jgi:hypothetical protein
MDRDAHGCDIALNLLLQHALAVSCRNEAKKLAEFRFVGEIDWLYVSALGSIANGSHADNAKKLQWVPLLRDRAWIKRTILYWHQVDHTGNITDYKGCLRSLFTGEHLPSALREEHYETGSIIDVQ